jgi:hypothetical protein
MATKLNAREQLVQFILDSGWELDPTKTVRANRSNLYSDERVQNPNAFRRPAHDGQFWEIELDYGYKDPDSTRLQALTLHLTKDGVLQVIGSRKYNTDIRLAPRWADSYNTNNGALWSITTGVRSNPSLRDRAEAIVLNPALAAWLVEEHQNERQARIEVQNKRRAEEAKARKRPLPITVSREDYRALVSTLDTAVWKLRRADGLSDLPALVADAQAAVNAVAAVLKPTAVIANIVG